MVSHEKILEKRLDDVRTFVNALKIMLIAQIPFMALGLVLTSIKYVVYTAPVLASIVLGQVITLWYYVRLRERLFEELGKDPHMDTGEKAAIYFGILGIVIIILLALAKLGVLP